MYVLSGFKVLFMFSYVRLDTIAKSEAACCIVVRVFWTLHVVKN